jgi:fluoroquinolone transport system permease protein
MASVVVTIIWAILLYPLSDNYKRLFIPFVIFIDLAIVGFYFMGAMVLFEKSERTIYAMTCTPLQKKTYFASKLATFSLLSLVTSVLLVLITYDFNIVNWGYLFFGVISNSLLYTMYGYIAIAPFNTITQYLVPSWLYLLLSQIPLVTYFEIIPDSIWTGYLFLLHPMQGSLNIIKAAFVNVDSQLIIMSVISIVVWSIIFMRLMYARFKKYIIEN